MGNHKCKKGQCNNEQCNTSCPMYTTIHRVPSIEDCHAMFIKKQDFQDNIPNENPDENGSENGSDNGYFDVFGENISRSIGFKDQFSQCPNKEIDSCLLDNNQLHSLDPRSIDVDRYSNRPVIRDKLGSVDGSQISTIGQSLTYLNLSGCFLVTDEGIW